MKHLRDAMDFDDRRRLAQIVTETCAAITTRLNVFLANRSQVGERAAWKIPRIQNVLEHEFLHFPDRKWLESYRISKDMFEQLTNDLRGLQRQATRLRNPVPVRTIAAMLLKRIGKGLDYREIGDKFGVGTSTACMKVNEAMKLLVSSKMHIISKLQRGIDFQRIINGFQRKWNFPQCLGAIDGTHIPIKAPLIHHADYNNRKSFHSVILQGVCDSQCCFTDVFAGWPGRAHDSRVFGRSGSDRQDANRGKTDTRWFKFVTGYWWPHHWAISYRWSSVPHFQASNEELSRQQSHTGKRTF